MTTFAQYDLQTGKILGFYKDEIHENIPENTVEITEDQWLDYLENQGKYIVDLETLELVEAPAKTNAELLVDIRGLRNLLLKESDWTQLPDALTTNLREAWAIYRQALRDFPSTCNPQNPVWPEKP